MGKIYKIISFEKRAEKYTPALTIRALTNWLLKSNALFMVFRLAVLHLVIHIKYVNFLYTSVLCRALNYKIKQKSTKKVMLYFSINL